MRTLVPCLLFAVACDGVVCGPGTIEIEDQCVPEDATGTSTGGTATGTATGGTATGGTATGGTATGGTATGGTATGSTSTGTVVTQLPSWWVDNCAPPDLWTGDIDPSLYSLTPYASTYDAYLYDLTNWAGLSGSASWGNGQLAIDATVTATGEYGWVDYDRVWVQDGLWAWGGVIRAATVQPGDRISIVVQGYETGGIIEIPNHIVMSTGNLVSVYDLEAENLDYDVHGTRLTHMYGEITQLSNHDCGSNMLCFRLEHNGTADLIRVPLTNSWGLDVDYPGGDCAEIIAPVNRYDGDTGVIDILDVLEPGFLRLYPAP